MNKEVEQPKEEEQFIPPQEIPRDIFIMELENRRSEALEHVLNGQGMQLNGQKMQFEAHRVLTSLDDLERRLDRADEMQQVVKFYASPEGLSFVCYPKERVGFQGTLKEKDG